MVTLRMKRINKEFLRLISVMLQCRIKNDIVKDAILTKVSVSKDLSYARVYYTLLDVSSKETLQSQLDLVSGQLRSILGKEMKLRKIPELNFIYDDTEVKAREMDRLLDRVAAIEAQKAVGLKENDEKL
ncbi:MAG: 30S ribosome-binding factor RbfA [Synergistaceae bacterium]|jgi:ribosome-binding factor A|nr:30S ribosome-binding factor RbfA [Synergistaceae bacterium]